jgi:hypothetical protein
MRLDLRKYNNYAICKFNEGSTTIDLGMLDTHEVSQLLSDLQSAVDDLQWFLESTKQPAIKEHNE